MSLDSFKTKKTLKVGKKTYSFYSLTQLEKVGFAVKRLPYSLKILLENLLRNEDGKTVTVQDIETLAKWDCGKEISFMPARVLLQDFTGVPCIADLAAMRDALGKFEKENVGRINPLIPAELVIDHSVQVDAFGTSHAFAINAKKEFERNQERYAFLRWGQKAFSNFKVVPPDTGIVHQVNLEYLARVVFENEGLLYPDTVIGTDSHTTMVNGLGVLGWGVGGIEAEAAMLGQPTTFLIPPVIGVKLSGHLPEGATATDLVLTITELLRQKKVVGKFVEFFGPGLANLGLADRATIANMAPEFGCTCALFPIDSETLDYLRLTGRDSARIDLVKAYAEAQGFFRAENSPDPLFTEIIELDLASIVASLAGPKRPQDRIPLTKSKEMFRETLKKVPGGGKDIIPSPLQLSHGSVVIAAITSCTNTSNPNVLMAAGLLAKKARAVGLKSKPWVKTSLAPGSKVVTAYLKESGLLKDLEALNFHLVGYGCTTCIGNSGPLPEPVAAVVKKENLMVAAVLSGNRNFEGRINPQVQSNYLASPPLVVAYALHGHMDWDPYTEPVGIGTSGKDIYLKDIWPTQKEISAAVSASVKPEMFLKEYAQVFEGDSSWKGLPTPEGAYFQWTHSTYVQKPPFFDGMKATPEKIHDIVNARVLVMLGDSVTTDHISPAGSIAKDSPAGKYLIEQGVDPKDFNSYGARRGNHEVMVRGTFANVRLKNELVPGIEGGVTRHFPSEKQMSIFETSLKYREEKIPSIVIAGKEYGSGSSRDWAAKGPQMLGIKAVIAESFERIHRSNLIGMGILPLEFEEGQTRQSLKLIGEETYSITGIAPNLKIGKKISVEATDTKGNKKSFTTLCRIDTPLELEYYRHGGILPFVLRQFL